MSNFTPARKGERGLTTPHSQLLDSLRQEFNTMFDRFFGRWPSLSGMGEEIEAMRFWEFTTADKSNEYIIRAELPGFDVSDLNILLNDYVLTIEAEKKR